ALEITDVLRVLDRGLPSRRRGVHRAVEAVEEEDLPAQTLEAEQVLEEHPGMPAAAGLLRQRAAQDDAPAHRAVGGGMGGAILPVINSGGGEGGERQLTLDSDHHSVR